MTAVPPRVGRHTRGALAVALAAIVAVVSVAGAWAAPLPNPLDAPIRAFGWPGDGAPNDPYYGIQTDLVSIGVASAWPRTTGSPSVVVAVLDTGLDAANAEFAGRIVPGFNALTGVADSPVDFTPTDDDAGHGTHVAGTIAAAGNNATGIVGIAPNVSIMPVKVLDSDGEGNFGNMVDGMDWAIDHGARIVTMSLGGTLPSSSAATLQPLFDTAHSAGVVVVAASGNEGTTTNEYPCTFTHVICVGSTTNDGTVVSTFSTRTSALALVAPGEGIASTLPGNGYGYGSGTSMATPHVTGAIALLRSFSPAMTADDVRTALILLPADGLDLDPHDQDEGLVAWQVGDHPGQLQQVNPGRDNHADVPSRLEPQLPDHHWGGAHGERRNALEPAVHLHVPDRLPITVPGQTSGTAGQTSGTAGQTSGTAAPVLRVRFLPNVSHVGVGHHLE